MTTAAICASREFAWSPSFYRGEQYDPDLGLYYLRARYYNPGTGRFMTRDPEAGNRFDPASLHKYLYAGGDPVNEIDPTGRDAVISMSLRFWLVAYRVELALDTAWQMGVYYGPLARPFVCMAWELGWNLLTKPGTSLWMPPFCQ
jgi:RHS repeat-associated protein